MNLEIVKTPALVLNAETMKRNAERLSKRVKTLGAKFRPHVKTHKCPDIARLQTSGHAGGIMVSTLAEARAFSAAGFRDITYGVPVEPGKFAETFTLARICQRFAVLTDDLETVRLLDETASRNGTRISVFLKVDSGYHRCGVAPESEAAIEIARQISDSKNLHFAGILTHAGHSYHAPTLTERLQIARTERDCMTNLAHRLTENNLEVPAVSIGSTPTVACVDDLEGVTEVRAGNYIFFDAFQATLGSCDFSDCALTVLTSVVHRSFEQRKIIVDAGATALSKDRGAVEFDASCGYGRVLDLAGNDLDLRVNTVSQEHGTIFVDDDALLEKLKVGTRLRILVNHSCLTAAQYDFYNVLEAGEIVDRWQRFNGW